MRNMCVIEVVYFDKKGVFQRRIYRDFFIKNLLKNFVNYQRIFYVEKESAYVLYKYKVSRKPHEINRRDINP